VLLTVSPYLTLVYYTTGMAYLKTVWNNLAHTEWIFMKFYI